MKKKTLFGTNLLRGVALGTFFLGCAVIGYWCFGQNDALSSRNEVQRLLFPMGLALLLAGLLTAALAEFGARRETEERPIWFFPLLSALLTLCGLSVAYIFLGIWPVGEKSCMLVDMHHQYAPLLAKLRAMLLGGDSFLYSFELGMGASALPAIAYYLASPLNLLLVLFPERLLTEGVFVITLVKNMLIAASAAVCLQYLYRRRTPAVAAVSLMYSMMMYVLAYSWNIMWLDGVMMLPLAVAGLEYLLRRGKYLPYVLALAYALYANYYIAFMLCVFLVLYFAAYLLRDRRDHALNRQALWRFTCGSLLGGGLAMVVVLPTFLALGQTSAAGAQLPNMDAYFNAFDLLGRHLYSVSPTIRSANLPNVYCGVALFVLVPLFAMNRGIPRRRRAVYMGLFAVMSLSLLLNQVNLLWHGLHAPNDLPYRFSFVYCFVLLLMGYETLLRVHSIRPRQLGGTLLGVAAYLVIEEKFGNSEYDFRSIYVTLLLVALYAACVWMMRHRRVVRRAVSWVLLAVVTVEMTLNAANVFVKLNNQEYYTAHSNYVDNLTTEALRQTVSAMKELDEADGRAFDRMEFLPRRTCMDTALFQYPGITSFASSNSYRTTRFMGAMGYAVNGVNSYLYKSFIPMVDSLLGIRYVALQNDIGEHPQLVLRDEVSVTEGTLSESYYIYENTAALPFAYRVNGTVREWNSSYYNPMESINSLYTALTGEQSPVTVAMPVQSEDADVTLRDTCAFYFNPSGTSSTVMWATADTDGRYFAYVDCRSADNATVAQGENSWSVSVGEPYFIDIGQLTAGDEVTVTLSSDTACSGNVFVLRLDDEVFQNALSRLSADGLNITLHTDERVEGTVNASADGVMFTTVPYDAGWRVKVDGKTVETYAIDKAMADDEQDVEGGALLGFDIPAGEHAITMVFRPRGFTAGVLLSIVSLLILVAVALATGRFGRRLRRSRLGWMFSDRDLDPHNPYAFPEVVAPAAPEPKPEEVSEE